MKTETKNRPTSYLHEYRRAIAALRFRAVEIETYAQALVDRDLMDAEDLRAAKRDADFLFKVATNLARRGLRTDGRSATPDLIDNQFDTVLREEANVCLVAGGALNPYLWLSEAGLREAKNLRARMARAEKRRAS